MGDLVRRYMTRSSLKEIIREGAMHREGKPFTFLYGGSVYWTNGGMLVRNDPYLGQTPANPRTAYILHVKDQKIEVKYEKPIDEGVWQKIEDVLKFDNVQGTPAEFYRYISPPKGFSLIALMTREPIDTLKRCALVVPDWYNYIRKVAPNSEAFFDSNRQWTYFYEGTSLRAALCSQIMDR